MKRFYQWVTLAALVVILAAGAASAREMINGAGATFPYPLYSKWFHEYENQSGYAINYQSIGSGGGIKQVTDGTVDFGASDAPLSREEQEKRKLVQVPMVAGAVAITYNLPGIGTGLKLTPEIISGIYLGKITRWNDPSIVAVNSGQNLPDMGIVVAHRSDGSGTTAIFTNYLSSISEEWKSKVGAGTAVKWPVGVGGKGNEGVAGVVKNTKGAIGYVELAYVVQNKMTYADIRNKAGNFITPSLVSVKAAAASFDLPEDFNVVIVNAPGANSYPIAGFTFLLLKKHYTDKATGKAVVEFVQWAFKHGDAMAEKLLYVPLPAEVKARALKRLEIIK